jgi:MFS family permease
MTVNPVNVGGTVSETEKDSGGVRAWITLGILMLMLMLSYLDRGLIALLVKPIREDFGISDVQISLLLGLAFSLFYSVFSVPLGWLADRWSRRGVIYVCITIWSVATAACGLANSFFQLGVARFAVGFGEGGLSPAAYSMLGDIFPKRRLGLALGIFAAGATVASPISLLITGRLIDWAARQGGMVLPLFGPVRPWQLVFLILGPPGLLLAPLIFLVRSDPHSRRTPDAGLEVAEQQAGDSFSAFLRSRWLYLTLVTVAFTSVVLFSFGVGAWAPTYFQRRFGLSMSEIGMGLGLVTGVAGSIGFVGGGWLADWLFSRGVRDAPFRYFVFGLPVVIVANVLAFAVIDRPVYAFVSLAFAQLLLPSIAPTISHLQRATPPHYRGRLIALFIMVFSVVGMTLGPLVVALLTEHVFRDAAKIGLSVAVTVAVAGTIAFLTFLASLGPARKVIADLAPL